MQFTGGVYCFIAKLLGKAEEWLQVLSGSRQQLSVCSEARELQKVRRKRERHKERGSEGKPQTGREHRERTSTKPRAKGEPEKGVKTKKEAGTMRILVENY